MKPQSFSGVKWASRIAGIQAVCSLVLLVAEGGFRTGHGGVGVAFAFVQSPGIFPMRLFVMTLGIASATGSLIALFLCTFAANTLWWTVVIRVARWLDRQFVRGE